MTRKIVAVPVAILVIGFVVCAISAWVSNNKTESPVTEETASLATYPIQLDSGIALDDALRGEQDIVKVSFEHIGEEGETGMDIICITRSNNEQN